jgi:hypothetical protein
VVVDTPLTDIPEPLMLALNVPAVALLKLICSC